MFAWQVPAKILIGRSAVELADGEQSDHLERIRIRWRVLVLVCEKSRSQLPK